MFCSCSDSRKSNQFQTTFFIEQGLKVYLKHSTCKSHSLEDDKSLYDCGNEITSWAQEPSVFRIFKWVHFSYFFEGPHIFGIAIEAWQQIKAYELWLDCKMHNHISINQIYPWLSNVYFPRIFGTWFYTSSILIGLSWFFFGEILFIGNLT